jgi:hypothetical protein
MKTASTAFNLLKRLWDEHLLSLNHASRKNLIPNSPSFSEVDLHIRSSWQPNPSNCPSLLFTPLILRALFVFPNSEMRNSCFLLALKHYSGFSFAIRPCSQGTSAKPSITATEAREHQTHPPTLQQACGRQVKPTRLLLQPGSRQTPESNMLPLGKVRKYTEIITRASIKVEL